MKTLKFKCELLSDVILNQKAASEGPNKTLDFIPGSCFLGIVANALYENNDKDVWEIVHSGKVRFGDAHPAFVDKKNKVSDRRSLRVPASYFFPKVLTSGKKKEGNIFIFHKTNQWNFQPVQMRNEFYDIVLKSNGNTQEIHKVTTDTAFAIKSDYNPIERRSQDEKMYGYESLKKGLFMYFEVECDDQYEDKILKCLIGEGKRVGRSRTAQFGLVKIDPFDYEERTQYDSSEDYTVVYADSRLIFLDEYGLPTFQPTAKDLGFDSDDYKIDWAKSQIRTFQYSPRNSHRNCFDASRCGIEKGSVFIVKTTQAPHSSKYVGDYKNEGFGKVIYNPSFLLQAMDDGKRDFNVFLSERKDKKKIEYNEAKILSGNKNLLAYLKEQKDKENNSLQIYELVNKQVEKWNGDRLFSGVYFKAQWGGIREIAMRYSSKKDLLDQLFYKTKEKNGEQVPDAYLTHGVAKEKWEEKGRLDAFRSFLDNKKITDENAQNVVINLASQMQKMLKEDR